MPLSPKEKSEAIVQGLEDRVPNGRRIRKQTADIIPRSASWPASLRRPGRAPAAKRVRRRKRINGRSR